MVAPNPTTLHLVADEETSKRRQILEGARKVFMDLGFDGASMGEITLEQGKVAFNFDPERDVTTTLMDFGQTYIQLLCRPSEGSAIRTVMAIAERMPEVGRRFYEHVLEDRINRLAGYLEAHVEAKDLAIEDCQLAAAQFMQMCQASLFLPFIFQAAPAPSRERIAQVIESATLMFLAAYQTKPA